MASARASASDVSPAISERKEDMKKQLTDKSLMPVAYQVRLSDGRWGTIFHHPDKPLGDHRPLYAYLPQLSELVVEALRELVTACEAYPVNIARADAALDNAHAVLRALKGEE